MNQGRYYIYMNEHPIACSGSVHQVLVYDQSTPQTAVATNDKIIVVLGDTIDTIDSIDIQRVSIYRGRLLAVSPIIYCYSTMHVVKAKWLPARNFVYIICRLFLVLPAKYGNILGLKVSMEARRPPRGKR